ncbi:MAG: PAS domain S-box protein [Gammaproteobacteria bacterium]|nr:PAS domain S-box protein [Gammaproteobacteria bacterium]MBU1415154.1 PAS domain S-box protein [Gammaproteobacteria bacterium]
MAEQLDIDFLLQRDRHAEALLELSRRIEGANTERDAFDAGFDILRANTGYQHYWVFILDEDNRHAHYYMGSTGPESDPSTATLTISGDPMLEEIVTSRDIVLVEDARTDPRTNKEIVARVGNRTIINVPIVLNASNLGAVGTGTFGDEGVRLPSSAEQDFLKAVASQLAISLDRIHNRNEWQRAEKELQAGEARNRSLILAMAEGVVFQNADGVITSANPAAERTLGLNAGTLLGQTSMVPLPVLTSDGRSMAEDRLPWNVTRNTGLTQTSVTLGTKKPDGSTVWLSVNTSPVEAGESAPYAVVTTFRDVTGQREMQQQLRMLQVALDGVSDCAFMMEDDRIVQVNQGACRSLGYSKDELIGMSVFDFDPVLTPEHLQHLITTTSDKPAIAFESTHRARDGRVFPVEVEVSPFTYDGRHLAMALTRDISERRKNEESLRRLNRTLLTLSSGNEALIRAGSEMELLHRMCHILVEVGGHRAVWIELTKGPDDKELIPSASATADESLRLDPKRVPRGNALAEALSSGEPKLIVDIYFDALEADVRADLLKAGCRSGLVLPLIASRGLIGVLSIFAENADAFDKAELDLLKELADDLAYGIQAQRIHAEQRESVTRLRRTMESTIVALANTLELRDPYTAGHQRRVATLAKAVALRLGFDEERAEAIYLAGMIHDIGKIYVPSEVLTRPGKLTPLEYSLVQTHVEAAYGILHPIDFPWPLADIVYQHHERLDGSGYPRGIRGEDIVLDSRILAVADVVEAMSTHRPYRPGLGIDAALAEIVAGKERLFDPAVVDNCVALFREDGFNFG